MLKKLSADDNLGWVVIYFIATQILMAFSIRWMTGSYEDCIIMAFVLPNAIFIFILTGILLWFHRVYEWIRKKLKYI